MTTSENMNKPPLVDSAQEFQGKIERIDVERVKSELFPGDGQVAVFYFNSIEGRNRPACVWAGQPPEKMDQYKKAILALIKDKYKENPGFFISVMNHSINIFAWGSPLLPKPYSEEFYYKLAAVNVSDMSIQPSSGKPEVFCRADEAMMHQESEIWRKIKKDDPDPLTTYAQAPRSLELDATIVDAHKIFKLLNQSQPAPNN